MKPTTTLLIVIAMFISNVTILNAQDLNFIPKGGEFIFNKNKTPCLTNEQRDNIKTQLKLSSKNLKSRNKLAFSEEQRIPNPKFIWPLQQTSGFNFNDTWAISGYVDHNSAFPDQLTDFNCGTTTYDTASGYNHQGFDAYLWPFSWKQMDDGQTEIIAAADGQIIDKGDGQFDRSCNFNSNQWNAVYVQHGDGSVAWYGHMKNGSVTSKNVGEMVSAGEYLGIVGSSGNSTGPHLHFEVYENNTYTQLIDPYAGTCNNLNTETWWQNQKPYINPKINAVLTHSQAPNVFPPCPTTETPYILNEFDISDDFYFAGYLRDQTVNDIVSFEIIKPDNSSLFGIWNATASATSSSWYYYYGPYTGYFDMVGEWKWKVTFGGETVTHTFNVSNALSVEDNYFEHTSIYPNPFKDVLNIKSNIQINKVQITNILGKEIQSIEDNNLEEINVENISNGLYFITLEGENKQRKTIKLIKK